MWAPCPQDWGTFKACVAILFLICFITPNHTLLHAPPPPHTSDSHASIMHKHTHVHSCAIRHPRGQWFTTRDYFINLITHLQSFFSEENREKSAACEFFAEAAKPCFILWPREKDVVLFYEWPQGFLNVLETQRVCPVKHSALMLFLFVWFVLFKFPPARRGKQSLTVKQIGKCFFSFIFYTQSCPSNGDAFRDNAGSSSWTSWRSTLSFHCVIISSTADRNGPLVCVRWLPTWQE